MAKTVLIIAAVMAGIVAVGVYAVSFFLQYQQENETPDLIGEIVERNGLVPSSLELNYIEDETAVGKLEIVDYGLFHDPAGNKVFLLVHVRNLTDDKLTVGVLKEEIDENGEFIDWSIEFQKQEHSPGSSVSSVSPGAKGELIFCDLLSGTVACNFTVQVLPEQGDLSPMEEFIIESKLTPTNLTVNCIKAEELNGNLEIVDYGIFYNSQNDEYVFVGHVKNVSDYNWLYFKYILRTDSGDRITSGVSGLASGIKKGDIFVIRFQSEVSVFNLYLELKDLRN